MTPSSAFRLDAACVGPQRTASSWLHDVLSHHPALCLPHGVKETMFFDERFENGLPWYESHFRQRRLEQRCIEVAPTYFDHDIARARLAAHNPALRVVVMVRNPVARAFSLYRLHVAKGRVGGSFTEAVAQIPRILTSGHYAQHGPAWEQAFGVERVHYVVQEDAQIDPGKAIAGVCAFLGVTPMLLPPAAATRHRAGPHRAPRYPRLARSFSRTATILRGWRLHDLVNFGKRLGLKRVYRGGDPTPEITPELYADLARRFSGDIDFLETRLGRDFSTWRTWERRSDP